MGADPARDVAASLRNAMSRAWGARVDVDPGAVYTLRARTNSGAMPAPRVLFASVWATDSGGGVAGACSIFNAFGGKVFLHGHPASARVVESRSLSSAWALAQTRAPAQGRTFCGALVPCAPAAAAAPQEAEAAAGAGPSERALESGGASEKESASGWPSFRRSGPAGATLPAQPSPAATMQFRIPASHTPPKDPTRDMGLPPRSTDPLVASSSRAPVARSTPWGSTIGRAPAPVAKKRTKRSADEHDDSGYDDPRAIEADGGADPPSEDESFDPGEAEEAGDGDEDAGDDPDDDSDCISVEPSSAEEDRIAKELAAAKAADKLVKGDRVVALGEEEEGEEGEEEEEEYSSSDSSSSPPPSPSPPSGLSGEGTAAPDIIVDLVHQQLLSEDPRSDVSDSSDSSEEGEATAVAPPPLHKRRAMARKAPYVPSLVPRKAPARPISADTFVFFFKKTHRALPRMAATTQCVAQIDGAIAQWVFDMVSNVAAARKALGMPADAPSGDVVAAMLVEARKLREQAARAIGEWIELARPA